MLFAAFPIVYEQQRGWSAGVGALPFLGPLVGFLLAVRDSLHRCSSDRLFFTGGRLQFHREQALYQG